MGATTKHALPYPDAGDPANVPQDMEDLADAIAAIIATADQGALAGRPVSTVGTPGVIGRFYYATDTGQLFWDTGTGWVEIISDGDTRLTNTRTPTDYSVTVDKLGVLPFAKLAGGGNQAITSGVVRLVTILTDEVYDYPAGEDQCDASNYELITQRYGLYHWEACVKWANGTTGHRWMFVYKSTGSTGSPPGPSGGVLLDTDLRPASGENKMHLSGDVLLEPGDSLRIGVLHTQGVNLNVEGGEWNTFIQWRYVGASPDDPSL